MINGSDREETLGFELLKGDLWYYTTDSLYQLDLKKNQLSKKYSLNLMSQDKVTFFPNSEILWIARDTDLIQVNLATSTTQTSKVIHRASNKLKGLFKSKNTILANTDYTVLALSKRGRIQQIVPVEGKRKLALIHIDRVKHTYLFDDGLLDIYLTGPKKKKQTPRDRGSLESSDPAGFLARRCLAIPPTR